MILKISDSVAVVFLDFAARRTCSKSHGLREHLFQKHLLSVNTADNKLTVTQ